MLPDPIPPGRLRNQEYVPRYRSHLEQLPGHLRPLAEFFACMTRLHTLAGMLDRVALQPGSDVLNIGCGPFATELFVGALEKARFLSLDYTAEFAPFLDIFIHEGKMPEVEFRLTDVTAAKFDSNRFDVVILHDILYEPALDLADLLAKTTPALRPGGVLFLDFVNARTAWLWRALGREKPFRRYDPDTVRQALAENGLEVVAWAPTHGAGNPLVALAHKTLWRLSGLSNAHAVLSRRIA